MVSAATTGTSSPEGTNQPCAAGSVVSAATTGTSSPEGTNQPCAAGSVPVLSVFIVGMLGRRCALSGGTPRAMLYNYVFRPLLTLFSPLYAVFFLFFLHVPTTSYFIIIPRDSTTLTCQNPLQLL